MTIFALALSLLLVGQDAPSPSANLVSDAMRSGSVGERYDGYLDFVGAPDETLRHAVGDLNIRRRALYTDLGERRGVAPHEVGVTAGCALIARTPVGGYYQFADRVWRQRKGEAAIALPSYCANRSNAAR